MKTRWFDNANLNFKFSLQRALPSVSGQSHDSSRPTFSLDDSTGSAGAPSHSAGGFCRSVSQGAHMSHSVGTRRQVSQPTPAPRSALSYGTPPPRYCDLWSCTQITYFCALESEKKWLMNFECADTYFLLMVWLLWGSIPRDSKIHTTFEIWWCYF